MSTVLKSKIDSIKFHEPHKGINVSLTGVPDSARQSISVSRKSTYGQDVWDMSLDYPNLHHANVILRFSKLSFEDGTNLSSPCKHGFLRSMREYIYSLIVDPPSMQPKWSTICNTYSKGVSALVRFMFSNGIRKFSELTPTDLTKFLEQLANTPLLSGKPITDQTLKTRASGLNWLFEQSRKVEDGLTNDPFIDYGSLSQWATKCCEAIIPRQSTTTVEIPDSVAREIMNHALEDLSIAETLTAIEKKRATHRLMKKRVGGKTIVQNPFPWDSFGLESGNKIQSLESRLIAACYIVIAMLTGMRWHEITSMKCGAINNWHEENFVHEGLHKRFYFVVSRTNKLQIEPTEYRWQTLPIVRRALDAAEHGLARLRKSNQFLFPSYLKSEGRISDGASSEILKRFISTHQIRHNDKLWPLSSHQFRKKFARIMTRQGLGIKALQDQLKHFDIEMTRGYGDINLYVELQREKFNLSTEQYEEILSSQMIVIGGGAHEVRGYQKKFLGMTKTEQPKFLQELPKAALIEQLDDGLCMYRSSKALCGGNSAACRPADCNNAVLPAAGKRKIYTWRISENRRLLEHFQNEPLKVAFLNARISELEKLLFQLEEAERI